MNYLYDGSYEGFLTCVHRHYYGERAEGIFPAESYSQLDMLRYALTVETDGRLAAHVCGAIEEKLSKWDAERVYRVFCTNEPEKEMKILRYLGLGFKRGSKIRLLHGDPVVKDVEAAEQRLGREVHRLTGLIRFSELDGGVLYSPITPDNDVLEFLAPHFSDRFRYDPFVIHDKARGKALFSYDKHWRIEAFDGEMLSRSGRKSDASGAPAMPEEGGTHEPSPSVLQDAETHEPSPSVCPSVLRNGIHETEGPSPSVLLMPVSESEEDIRVLWKQYFEVMAIKERVNPNLQRQFVPVRYRKHLPEFSE